MRFLQKEMKTGVMKTYMFISFYKRDRPNDSSLLKQKINWKVEKNLGATAVKGNTYMFSLFFSVRNQMMRFLQNKTLQSAGSLVLYERR